MTCTLWNRAEGTGLSSLTNISLWDCVLLWPAVREFHMMECPDKSNWPMVSHHWPLSSQLLVYKINTVSTLNTVEQFKLRVKNYNWIANWLDMPLAEFPMMVPWYDWWYPLIYLTDHDCPQCVQQSVYCTWGRVWTGQSVECPDSLNLLLPVWVNQLPGMMQDQSST